MDHRKTHGFIVVREDDVLAITRWGVLNTVDIEDAIDIDQEERLSAAHTAIVSCH
jgi:hypothetical protein